MQQSFVGPNFFMSHCRCFLAMRFYHNHDQGPINALPVFFTTLPSICNFWYTLTNKGKQWLDLGPIKSMWVSYPHVSRVTSWHPNPPTGDPPPPPRTGCSWGPRKSQLTSQTFQSLVMLYGVFWCFAMLFSAFWCFTVVYRLFHCPVCEAGHNLYKNCGFLLLIYSIVSFSIFYFNIKRVQHNHRRGGIVVGQKCETITLCLGRGVSHQGRKCRQPAKVRAQFRTSCTRSPTSAWPSPSTRPSQPSP